jgi:D-xylose transport system substrate-binding protein
MRKRFLMTATALGVSAVALAACSSSSSGGGSSAGASAGASVGTSVASSSAVVASSSTPPPASSSAAGGGGSVGVILPDTKSSNRWQDDDLPDLKAAFAAAGVTADIQNAQGSTSTFVTIAQGMINKGVKVLIITNLDSASGAQVETLAKKAGIKTIDYDRLTLGGSADYYVSFDGVKVGELQGKGLMTCLQGKTDPTIIEINGSPTDNNATLFAQGYNSILDPLYKASKAKKVGDQSVPAWDNVQAGVIFQQLLTRAGGKVDGVLVANDGMAQSVITKLAAAGLKGTPVTGQDATVPGLQQVLAGNQCMTVYKAVKKEADGAATLAISLIKGTKATTNATSDDPVGKRKVPSVLLTPEAIFKNNVEDVIKDGYVKASDVCTSAYASLCTKYGVK